MCRECITTHEKCIHQTKYDIPVLICESFRSTRPCLPYKNVMADDTSNETLLWHKFLCPLNNSPIKRSRLYQMTLWNGLITDLGFIINVFISVASLSLFHSNLFHFSSILRVVIREYNFLRLNYPLVDIF